MEITKKVLQTHRGNCLCGRWLMIHPDHTIDDPFRCECGRRYFSKPEPDDEFSFHIMPGEVKPALFLDLDETVRYSKNGEFINHPDDVALYPDVEEMLWSYRDQGFLIFGVTNQGGVAFGYKSELSAEAEVTKMCHLFSVNPFHAVQSCFYHPGGNVEPYNRRSILRKPATGMLALLEVEAFVNGYLIDWDRSIFVGDRPEDKVCAANAEIEFQWAHEFFNRPKPKKSDSTTVFVFPWLARDNWDHSSRRWGKFGILQSRWRLRGYIWTPVVWVRFGFYS